MFMLLKLWVMKQDERNKRKESCCFRENYNRECKWVCPFLSGSVMVSLRLYLAQKCYGQSSHSRHTRTAERKASLKRPEIGCAEREEWHIVSLFLYLTVQEEVKEKKT